MIQEQEEQEQEHLGGGRFNRLLGVVFMVVAMAGGVALALGVQSSGTGQSSASQNQRTTQVHRPATGEKSRTSRLMAAVPHAAPTVMPTEPVMPISQRPFNPRAEELQQLRAMGRREVHEGA